MKFFYIIVFCLINSFPINAQDDLVNCDLHSHITFKKYPFSVVDPAYFVDSINKYCQANNLSFEQLLLDSHHVKVIFNTFNLLDNWVPLENNINLDEYSDWVNYSQADYKNIALGKYKFVCTSISPLEPPLLQGMAIPLVISKARMQSRLTGITLQRVKEYSNGNSFKEYLAEYYYLRLSMSYKSRNDTLASKYELKIVSNLTDFNFVRSRKNTIGIIPTIEGAFVMHSSNYFNKKFYNYYPRSNDKDNPWSDYNNIEEIKRALITNIRKARENGTVFLTGAHFSFVDLFGHVKALDKENKRGLLTYGSGFASIRTALFKKHYDGAWPTIYCINNSCEKTEYNDVNLSRMFLDELWDLSHITCNDSIKWRPIWFDYKHCDPNTFVQIEAYRRKIEDSFNINLPVIYSHAVASGQSRDVGVYTGLCPNYDRYKETLKPHKFYIRKAIGSKVMVPGYKNQLFAAYYKERIYFDSLPQNYTNYLKMVVEDQGVSSSNYDGKIEYNDLPKVNIKAGIIGMTLGVYNPFSLNLDDGQIQYIFKNNGIVGLMPYQKALGSDAPYYTKKKLKYFELKDSTKKSPYKAKDFKISKVDNPYCNQNISGRIDIISDKFDVIIPRSKDETDLFIALAPFWRNVLYIAEKSGFANDKDINKRKEVWNYFAIGSDNDGYANPIKGAARMRETPQFKQNLVNYFDAYCLSYNIIEYLPDKFDLNTSGALQKKPSDFFYERWGISVQDAVEEMFSLNMQIFFEKWFKEVDRINSCKLKN